MLDEPSPVDGFLPIVPPNNSRKDAPLPPQKPSEVFFRGVAESLRKVSYDDLASGVPSRIKDIPPNDAKPALEFLMLQEVRKIYDESNCPADLFQANQRNREQSQSGSAPIRKGDYLHGMPIKFFQNAGYGVLAPEFYGGRTQSSSSIYCSLYVSEVINVSDTDAPEQIIKWSHTKGYGLQEGMVTVVFDKQAPMKNLHRGGMIGGAQPTSVARAVSVGESLTSVKCCIVSNPADIPEMKNILSSFNMYIPLYDGNGNNLFTQEDWLKTQARN